MKPPNNEPGLSENRCQKKCVVDRHLPPCYDHSGVPVSLIFAQTKIVRSNLCLDSAVCGVLVAAKATSILPVVLTWSNELLPGNKRWLYMFCGVPSDKLVWNPIYIYN